jgi:thioredoxin-related protein
MTRTRKRWIQVVAILAFLAVAGVVRQARSADVPPGWTTDLPKAQAQAVETGKPVLVMFSAVWCAPCTIIKKDVFPKEQVQAEFKNWSPVYIDEADDPTTTEKFKIEGFPTFVMLDAAGKEMDRFLGAPPEMSFLKGLRAVRSMPAAREQVAKLPDEAKAWKSLGDAHFNLIEVADSPEKSQMRIEEATRAFERAAFLDPKNETGAAAYPYYLKALPRKMEDLAASLEKLDKFEAMFPKSELLGEVFFYRAVISRDLGEKDKALAVLKEAVERFPKSDYFEAYKKLEMEIKGGA